MDKLVTLFNEIGNGLVSWFSHSFTPWFFEASYYVGVGSGLLIACLIFGLVFDKLLTHLTFKYEVSTWGVIPNPPQMNEEQKQLLKETLYWWNKQCDSWYMSSCVDKALEGKEINLIDAQRLSDSTTVGKDYKRFIPTEETQEVFDQLGKSLSGLIKELQKEVDFKKLNHKVIKETDALSKQVKIAQYSAIAAVASAIATMFLTYITYINME